MVCHCLPGAEAQEAQHGDAAKSQHLEGILFPVSPCGYVVNVSFIDQREPDIDIREIGHLRGWDWRKTLCRLEFVECFVGHIKGGAHKNIFTSNDGLGQAKAG